MESQSHVSVPLKISTITAIAKLNANVDLALLFRHLELVAPAADQAGRGIAYVEYAKKKGTLEYKGYLKESKCKKRASKRPFDNQTTVHVKYGDSLLNVKVFRNGNVQITGLQRIEHGLDALGYLCDRIRAIPPEVLGDVVDDASKLRPSDLKVCLINSDFKVDFEIRRDKLFRLLTSTDGGDAKVPGCTYEPCIYPGVKIQYFWNERSPTSGCCACAVKCQGAGDGRLECRKITIAVFQSGCVIVTGGHSYEQIEHAYEYILGILIEHMDAIRKPTTAAVGAGPT